MTTRERAPTVREVDMETMRAAVGFYIRAGMGWEDAWRETIGILPPSISREDVRRFVIPRLAK